MEANESTRVSGDLTSTIEIVLTNNGHGKKINHSDSVSVGDSTPSSSSDANMQAPIVKTIHDDPISSTSDSLTHETEMNLNVPTPDINFIVGVETSRSINDLGSDTDFFTSELNIESMSTEKISEDVEDIANDLENLLGGTTHSYGVICSNSDTITKPTEKLKIISTSSSGNSGNLFVGHDATVNISDDLSLRPEDNKLDTHDKSEATVSTEVNVCDKSDILELGEKIDTALKYSPVTDSNNASELSVPEKTSNTHDKDTQDSIIENTELQKDCAQIEGQGVSSFDNVLCESTEPIDKSPKQICHDQDTSDKTLNDNVIVIKEGTDINLDSSRSSEKLDEDKEKTEIIENNPEVKSEKELEETASSVASDLNSVVQNITEVLETKETSNVNEVVIEEEVSVNLLATESSQSNVIPESTPEKDLKENVVLANELLDSETNMIEVVNESKSETLLETIQNVDLESVHSELIIPPQITCEEINECDTKVDVSLTETGNSKSIQEDGASNLIFPEVDENSHTTVESESLIPSEDVAIKEVEELNKENMETEEESINLATNQVPEKDTVEHVASTDINQEIDGSDKNDSQNVGDKEEQKHVPVNEIKAITNYNEPESADNDSDQKLQEQVSESEKLTVNELIQNINENEQCTINQIEQASNENVEQISNETNLFVETNENDNNSVEKTDENMTTDVEEADVSNNEIEARVDKTEKPCIIEVECDNRNNTQEIVMETADTDTGTSNKDRQEVIELEKAVVSSEQISTTMDHLELPIKCESSQLGTSNKEIIVSTEKEITQKDVGVFDQSSIQGAPENLQDECKETTIISADTGNSEKSAPNEDQSSVVLLSDAIGIQKCDNEEANNSKISENVNICDGTTNKNAVLDNVTESEEPPLLEILKSAETTALTDEISDKPLEKLVHSELIGVDTNDEKEIDQEMTEKNKENIVEDRNSDDPHAFEECNESVKILEIVEIPEKRDLIDKNVESISECLETSKILEEKHFVEECTYQKDEDLQKDSEQQKLDNKQDCAAEDGDNSELPIKMSLLVGQVEEISNIAATENEDLPYTKTSVQDESNCLPSEISQEEKIEEKESLIAGEMLDDTGKEVDSPKELANIVEFYDKDEGEIAQDDDLDIEHPVVKESEIQERKAEEIKSEESFPEISESNEMVAEIIEDSSRDNLIDPHESDVQKPFEMFDEVKCDLKSPNHNSAQLHPEDDSDSMHNKSFELREETTTVTEYPQSEDMSNENSELQCAISHIVDTTEPIENSEGSELQSAISEIMNSPEIAEDCNLSHLDCTIPRMMDSSDTEAFELQNAISQIVYPSETTDDCKASELQTAISQIIDVSERGDDSDGTSELQNAITQIIYNPELEQDCKIDGVLNIQLDSQNIAAIDDFEHENDKIISTDLVVDSQNNLKNDELLFDEIGQSAQMEGTSTSHETIEGEVKIDATDEKVLADVEIQSIYSEPVHLMLDDMDDQLKNVIFESKSQDSIPNIANISEVDLDTPKTFDSQHMDLMLPEESSLLNTDVIISEIAPAAENVVEFTQEVGIKLETHVIPEDELKLGVHENDSKDLNDVIAREIESLLELQSQDLPDDSSSVDNSGENVKIGNQENQISAEEDTYRHSNAENEKVDAPIIEENVFEHGTVSQQATDTIESNISFIQEELTVSKDTLDRAQDSTHFVDHGYRETELVAVKEKPLADEVSSSFVVNVPASANQEIDSLITSTASIEQSVKTLDSPLVIEIGTSTANMDEKHSHLHPEIAEVATSNYSSKMSENEDLKMTITKHKIEFAGKVSESSIINETHSILKIYDPKDVGDSKKVQKAKEATVPKLIIKPIIRSQPSPTPSVKLVEEIIEQTVPKLFIRNMSPNRPGSPKVVKSQKSETSPLKLTIKPLLKSEECQPKSSPKLTIKPIIKTEEESSTSGPKITIKPIIKPPEDEMCHSPKITIKPIIKHDECQSELVHSPRITIKPIPKPDDVKEFCASEIQSPRITIKPVIKPDERNSPEQDLILKKSDLDGPDRSHSPRITIKPIIKPEDHKSSSKLDQKLKQDDICKGDKKEGSPKITIKPIMKPVDTDSDSVELIDFEDQIKQERIVLKINKNSMAKDSRKRDSTEEIEKLAKIKLKFSKEGGHAQIISEQSKLKRALEESIDYDQKRVKFESDDLTITPIDADGRKVEKVVEVIKDDVNITPIGPINRPTFDDPLEKIPIFEITPESAVMMKSTVVPTVQQVTAPAPRKRGRPRKVPLVVREEFKDIKEEEIQVQEQQQPAPEETGRPKRSCRGPSVRTTLGIRTRKPRGSGRGRGRGRGARGVGSRGGRQQRVSAAKLKLLKEEAAAAIAEQSQILEPEDGGDVEMKGESPVVIEDVTTETPEIVLIEEETRMSADINTSRAQTPARQVDNSVPTPGDVEDTQSSVQSTATTESTKARKGTRLEVHQEPEGEVISADQLTEYYWGGGGPYMLQEQVAQFLGIKSFKRKYPGIQRRTVDMQERDFIRESGLASEAMCDLGLTAVHSADILDIMYSDFQHKYEEYCKHQRDRQAKDFSNKQKALSLAASQEKNKQDIMQQAVQSAASWNANFNKSRKDERKACMDLQTFTVHYPKGRFKTGERNKVGHYPVALVPGQYTDYYKALTPAELSNLPLNTMLNKPLNIPTEDDSPSDGSGSDSDSSSSDSDSSSSDSSDEDCNICSPTSSSQTKKVLAN